LPSKTFKLLKQFKDIFAIDGSVIALCKQVEEMFASTHKNMAALKLNAKFSLFLRVLTKLQVTKGKRHDSRFNFITKEANILYLLDLGYWSFGLMQQIINADSFFVMRLKKNCDPLIIGVKCKDLEHLVGKRLSEVIELFLFNKLRPNKILEHTVVI
jgi:hypothetical protein